MELFFKKPSDLTNDLAKYLDKYKIGNRMLFGGNLLKQPAFVELIKSNEKAFRVVGSMEGSDDVMNNALFLGTFPGLTNKMIDFIFWNV